MKDKLKLWLRRWFLRTLIKLVDRAEERLQAWQVSLRESLRRAAPKQNDANPKRLAAECSSQAGTRHHSPAATLVAGETLVARPHGRRETWSQWEARRSGVAVISKKEARRRRERVTASAFDLRFAR
jgi:hypothetical protein